MMSNNRRSDSTESHQVIGFKEVEHTADNAMRVFGANLEEFLLNAARGMNSLMASQPVSGTDLQEKYVEIEAIDIESLLVDWLSELAYWAELEMLVFDEFKIERVSSTYLQAKIYGIRVTQLKKHIKAATYHNLDIVRTENGFTATVVFDV